MIFNRNNKARGSGGSFRFRVSDAAAVPVRGYLLRMRLLDGSSAPEDVSPDRKLSLRSPNGTPRTVVIKDLSNTNAGTSRDLPERTRQPDLVISQPDASVDRV